MAKKLNIAVIGVGYLGNYHTEKYAKLDSVNLVGVVDSNINRATQIANTYKTRAFSDVKDILDKVDAVSIAVPTDHHYDVAKRCLEHNIDVLIEKPITHKVWQAERLLKLAEEKNRIIQVGHLERFNPAIQKVSTLLKRPLFIECHRLHSFVQRGTEVDVVLDLMIHDLDIILSLVGSEIIQTEAVGVHVLSDLIDIANVRLKFASGCVANVTASRVSLKPMRKLRIFEPDCYVSVDFKASEVQIFRKVLNKGEKLAEVKAEVLSLEKKDALEEEIKSFIDAIENRTKPVVSAKEALAALIAAQNIITVIQNTQAQYAGVGSKTFFGGPEARA